MTLELMETSPGTPLGDFMIFIDELRPWFTNDGIGEDNDVFSEQVRENKKKLHALGERIYDRYQMQGLYAAHDYASSTPFFGRFVEHSFNDIGPWRS